MTEVNQDATTPVVAKRKYNRKPLENRTLDIHVNGVPAAINAYLAQSTEASVIDQKKATKQIKAKLVAIGTAAVQQALGNIASLLAS